MMAQITPHRGSNQSGMRAYNERLVLTLVRLNGALAKSDIARITGLSAQTVSVIVRELEGDGLLVRGEPVRGRVGQPSVPMMLNPKGAYFLGLKVGRRSAKMVLVDFVGKTIGAKELQNSDPTVDATLRFACVARDALLALLPSKQRGRVAGMGIAMPFRMWEWPHFNGAQARDMADWKARDLRAEIADGCNMSVVLQNDATAACGAELVFGTGKKPRDFLYFYIGFFIGGGVVLNGRLEAGRTGNAAALGSMPVEGANGVTLCQLIDVASISVLEKTLQAQEKQVDAEQGENLYSKTADWDVNADILTDWIAGAGRGIALAIASASAVFDFEAALIDGLLPEKVRARIVAKTRLELEALRVAGTTAGLDLPYVRAGTVGKPARTLGAAALPLSERFLVDSSAFLKTR